MDTNVDAPMALDPDVFPNLTGPEALFYEFWWKNIMRPEDPHVLRWLEYEEGAVERARERLAQLQRIVELDGAKVLEVGCQAGAALIALDQLGADAVGIDIDDKAVAGAGFRAEGYGAQVRAEVGTASELPYGTGQFDVSCPTTSSSTSRTSSRCCTRWSGSSARAEP